MIVVAVIDTIPLGHAVLRRQNGTVLVSPGAIWVVGLLVV